MLEVSCTPLSISACQICCVKGPEWFKFQSTLLLVVNCFLLTYFRPGSLSACVCKKSSFMAVNLRPWGHLIQLKGSLI